MPRFNNVNLAHIEKHTSHSQDIKYTKAYIWNNLTRHTQIIGVAAFILAYSQASELNNKNNNNQRIIQKSNAI